jgi:hypothetical protein
VRRRFQSKTLNRIQRIYLTTLTRLEADTRLPEGSVRSIRNLQEIARKVFYQSQWAYDPSPKEAEEFVLYSAAARNDLGEKVQ